MKRKLYFGIFLVCLLSFLGRAQAFEVDGIYYGIISSADRTVKVVKPAFPATYEGDIVIPDSVSYDGETYRVASIGDNAFYDCRSLTSIELPAGLTSIGDYAFNGCAGLTSIDLPESLTRIMPSAFKLCTSLTSIDLPAGLETINPFVFYACSSLTAIELPAGLESIGEGAFYACSSLTAIELPAGLTSIGRGAFRECRSLTAIELPEALTSIVQSAFEDCSSLTAIELPAGLERIGKSAFSGCRSLTAIELPEGLESIGEYAFSGCTGLTDIELPEGLTSIGEYVFEDCSSLTEIDLPESVDSIGGSAFSFCRSLTAIELPAGLTSIGDYAFNGCTGLTEIDLPAGLTSIAGMFAGCRSLTAIELPAGLERIGKSAFSGCTSLTEIDLPESVDSIGGSAFSFCRSLTSIDLPAGLTSIGARAFEGCTSLTAIDLPSSLDSIGNMSFVGTGKLTEVFLWTSSWPKLGGNYVWYDPYYVGGDLRNKTLYTFIQEGSDQDGWNVGDDYDLKAKVVLSVSMEDTLHVYDGSVPLVSIEGNTSSFQMEVIQDSVDAGAGSHQIEELYFWFGKQGDEANKKISKAALPDPYLSYTITKAPLQVTAGSYTMTYGDEVPEFAFSYDGFVNGEDSTVLVSQPVIRCEAGENPGAGEYVITVSGGEADNYGFEYVAGKLTVEKAPLKVAAQSYTMTYGDEVPEFAFSYDGFVNGEDSTVLVSQPVIACEAGENPDAGEYAITVSGGEADNYEFEYVAGKLTVEKAAQTIEWKQEFAEEVLAGTEILLEATASSGLEVSYASSNEEVAVIRQEDGQSKVVCIAEGEVEITASQAGDKNHEAAEDVRKTLRVKADVGNEPAWASGIELYPNPVRDELKIQGTNAGMKIRVFHANGHAVSLPQGGELQASDGLTILRVSSLPSGFYLLQLVQDGQTHVLRFVKN